MPSKTDKSDIQVLGDPVKGVAYRFQSYRCDYRVLHESKYGNGVGVEGLLSWQRWQRWWIEPLSYP